MQGMRAGYLQPTHIIGMHTTSSLGGFLTCKRRAHCMIHFSVDIHVVTTLKASFGAQKTVSNSTDYLLIINVSFSAQMSFLCCYNIDIDIVYQSSS